MPQKKMKKAKAEKTKKPLKPAKVGAVGAVLKKAAKTVAKKIVGLNLSKKPAPVKKPLPAAKPEKAAKKPEALKKPALIAKGKKTEPVLTLVKDKKDAAKQKPVAAAAGAKPAAAAAKPAAAAKVEGKKKTEVVVVVPAPKGVALLGRDGKKKAKAAAESAASKKRCREPGCEHDFTLNGYCRLHYIKNWRRIKRKESILASGQLNNYVEELVNKYPDKYLDVIRQDLATEKEWGKVVGDLELEAADEEGGADDDMDSAPEGVRPASGGGGGGRGTDFDDEGETF